MKRLDTERGFTIIELLIALGIAMIIILGLYSFLVDTQRTYMNVASNEQGNRRVMNANNAMLNYINQAGFANFTRRFKRASLITFSKTSDECEYTIASGVSSGVDTWRDICVDTKGKDGYGEDSPQIYVHFSGSSIDDQLPVNPEPDVAAGLDGVKDDIRIVLGNAPHDYADNRSFICSGESIDNSHEVVVRLSLQPHEGTADKSSDLTCETVYDNGPKSNPQKYVLERNIDKLSIRLYICAVAQGGGDLCKYRSPDRLRDGLKVPSSARWDYGIGAVRYVMLQSEESGQKVIKNDENENVFKPWEGYLQEEGEDEEWKVGSDSRVRQIIANEAYLRNGNYD